MTKREALLLDLVRDLANALWQSTHQLDLHTAPADTASRALVEEHTTILHRAQEITLSIPVSKKP